MAFPGMQTHPGANGQGEFAGVDPQQQMIMKMVGDQQLPLAVQTPADSDTLDASWSRVLCW